MNKKLITLLGGLLLLALASGSLAQDVEGMKFPKLNKIQMPQVEKVTLDNGLRLYFLEDRSLPIFRLSARINGGAFMETADQIGLGMICGEVMRTGGTSKWTGDEIDEMLEGIGGSVGSYVGMATSGGSVNMLSEYSDMGLEVLAEVFRNPQFSEDKIELAKVQAKSGISRRNDAVGAIAGREFGKLIYGAESPYTAQMEYAHVDAITRDNLIAFYKMIFHPENVQMAIWGDYDQKKVIAKIKELFGDWEKGSIVIPSLPAVNYQYRSQVYAIDKPDARQAYIRIGHIGGLVGDEDYTARIVMNSIFGGGFGSRLTDNVRTRLGLAYSAYGRYGANISYPGMFFAHASTGNANAIKAAAEMLVQIKTMLTTKPDPSEMQKGKDGYLNSFVFKFDTKGEVVNRLMTYDFYGYPEDFLQKTKEGVEAVTAEAVLQAAQKNLHPDQLVVLIVGNLAEFEQPISDLGLGEPEMIDITIPAAVKKLELVINEETLTKGNDLMDMVVTAHGGLDNFKKVKSYKMAGTVTIHTPQGDIPLGFDEIHQMPYLSRATFNMMGREMIDVTGDGVGWQPDQTGGLVEKTEADLAKDRTDKDRSLIYLLSRADLPLFRAVYLGVGEKDSVEVDFLAIIDTTDSQICQLTINSESFRIVAKTYEGQTMMGSGTVEDIFSDMTEIDGLLMPMKMKRTLNGEGFSDLVYSEYLINVEVPAGTFDKPTP